MPAYSWSDLISAEEMRDVREAELACQPEWSIDFPGYANPHEFDRAAVGDFLDRAWRDAGCDLVEVYREHIPTSPPSPLSRARRHLVDKWIFSETTDQPEVGWVSVSAAQYLDARGYPLGRLVALAEPVRTLLDGMTVRDGMRLADRDAAAGFDDLDYVLVALLAGLAVTEINTALTQGAWPDLDALDLLQALA